MISTASIAAIVCSTLLASIFLGRWLRRVLAADQFTDHTRDTVKVSIGLVATMAAMVLGLLVSSARDSFEASRTLVIQMGAKIKMLDRILTLYGPDAAMARTAVRVALEDSVQSIWPVSAGKEVDLSVKTSVGGNAYSLVIGLEPGDNKARQVLKDQAVALMTQTGEMRTLLEAQSASGLSLPLLLVMVCWLAIIFTGFALLAPVNPATTISLCTALLCCGAAITLILELNRPFTGHIRVPREPLQRALDQMTQQAP